VIPPYTPMAPTLVRLPFHRDGWVYEERSTGGGCWRSKDGEPVCSRNEGDPVYNTIHVEAPHGSFRQCPSGSQPTWWR
jgi:hypothetical protein